jgi:signal transduction histidine kinase
MLIALIVVTCAVLAIALTAVWRQERSRLEETLRSDAVRSSQILRAFLARRIDRGHTFSRAVAESSQLRRALGAKQPRRVQAALRELESEFESYHLVVYDEQGKAVGWSNALGLSALGLDAGDAGPAGGSARPKVIHGDLALMYELPIESARERIGSFRLAVLVGRLFVSRVARDIDRPVALQLEGRTVHSTFGTPPAPVPEGTAPETEGGSHVDVSSDGRFLVAWTPYRGEPDEEPLWLVAGVSRAPLEAARQAFLQLTGLVVLGGLVVVAAVVGAFGLYRWRRERHLIQQRDAALGRSEGLSHRVADLTAVVHDIKAPVAGIQMLCEGLGEGTTDPATRQALDRIVDTCERMSLFLVNVLTAAKAEEGPLEPRNETVLVAGLTDEVVEKLEPVARRKGVALVADPAIESLPALSGDSTLLERALSNLVANAIEASPEGGTVRVTARREGGEVSLSVEDDGPGFETFPPESAFERGRPAVKDDSIKAGSSGLGLYIVRRIAEAHGGRATAENRPEGGARVTFTIGGLLAGADGSG